MQPYRLERHGKLDLVFEGEIIAEADSDDGEKPRWQHYVLYRTTHARKRYVLERLGESRLPGEITMREVIELPNAHQVRKALERRRENGERYLTIVALDLLREAADVDPTFKTEMAEQIG